MGVNFTFNPVIGQERELKLAGAEKQREQSQENQWELTGKCQTFVLKCYEVLIGQI